MKKINSFISWIGGKRALRGIILSIFPMNYKRYVEVFGGGASILFAKDRDKDYEVYNDFNSDLVNLFRCVRDRPLAFLNEARFFPLASREEFQLLLNLLERKEFDNSFIKSEIELAERILKPPDVEIITAILTRRSSLYDVERAVAFYKIVRTSYGSGCKSFGPQQVNFSRMLESIYGAAQRLDGVIIENKDFGALIAQYDRPETFFYCDPPYFETEDCYTVGFEKENHVRLRDVLRNIKGKFLLSYNDCPFAKEFYNEFYIIEVSRLNSMAQRYGGGSEFKEVLIANYDVNERRLNKPKQISLFDEGDMYEKDYIKDFRYQRTNHHPIYIPKSFRDRV